MWLYGSLSQTQALGSNERLRSWQRLFGLRELDQLVPRRLGSTVPRLIEVRDRRARHKNGPRGKLRLDTGCLVRCLRDAREDRSPRKLVLFAARDDLFHLRAERVNTRIRIPPRVNERGRIKRTDQMSDLIEFQQSRASRDQQTNGQLNRRNVLDQIVFSQDAQ